MTKKRIFFTGGSGKAGRHVIPHLLNQGYRVLNVDLLPLHHPGVDNLHADITDSGQMFDAMTSYAGLDELELGTMPSFDAVVHFAAVPRILLKPDNETFRVNTIGTYNVIEAAVKMGIKKIIIASSETTYGVCFSNGETDPHSLPLEEDYDIDPMDSYGLSKLVNAFPILVPLPIHSKVNGLTPKIFVKSGEALPSDIVLQNGWRSMVMADRGLSVFKTTLSLTIQP